MDFDPKQPAAMYEALIGRAFAAATWVGDRTVEEVAADAHYLDALVSLAREIRIGIKPPEATPASALPRATKSAPPKPRPSGIG